MPSASTGASGSSVTAVESAAVPSDQMPVGPRAATMSCAAANATAPCEPSARRAVRLPGVPFQSVAGTKRSQYDVGSTSAAVSDSPAVGTAAQVDPSAEYCQAPSVAVAAAWTMATPASAVAWAPSTASL